MIEAQWTSHQVTREFESELCRYTGAPFAVAVDNCSNALFLALTRNNPIVVSVPKHTYPSVPCEVLHSGAKIRWIDNNEYLSGSYRLAPTNVWDCSLDFTADMYLPGQFMCLSFTGPFKHLKLGKGGAILTDDKDSYEWFKKARFSGRSECSYLEDTFEMTGWNFYMMPEIAAKGLQLMAQFYDEHGYKVENSPKRHRYPDLSKFPCYA